MIWTCTWVGFHVHVGNILSDECTLACLWNIIMYFYIHIYVKTLEILLSCCHVADSTQSFSISQKSSGSENAPGCVAFTPQWNVKWQLLNMFLQFLQSIPQVHLRKCSSPCCIYQSSHKKHIFNLLFTFVNLYFDHSLDTFLVLFYFFYDLLF